MDIDAPPQSRADLEAELRAVQAAYDASTRRRQRIQLAINRAWDIEAIGSLHEEWSIATEEQAAARDRQRELESILAQTN